MKKKIANLFKKSNRGNLITGAIAMIITIIISISVMLFIRNIIDTSTKFSCPSIAANEVDSIHYGSTNSLTASDSTYDSSVSNDTADNSTIVNDSSAKLITNVNIYAMTKNYDAVVPELEQKAISFNGYVESSTKEDPYNYDYKRATYRIRIPAENLSEYIEWLSNGEEINITKMYKDVEDITLEYTDTQSHLESLKDELSQLKEMLKKCENMTDMAAIQTEISNTQYQIDSIQSQMNIYDNEVNYSTVYIELTESGDYISENSSISERVVTGFHNNLISLKKLAVNIFVWFIVHIIEITAFIIIIVIIFIITQKKSYKKDHQNMQKK